jgi:hypothetical protein
MTGSAIDIGSRLELFVDDYLIESMDGTELKLHKPVAREIALQHDRPWEGDATWCPVVIKDGDRYKMWYRAGTDTRSAVTGKQALPARPTYTVAYAESTDGIQWQRPSLGIYEFEGSTDNNILMDSEVCHNLSVFIDGRPGTPDTERYKAIAKGSEKVADRGTLRGLVSADGIHWRVTEPDPLIVAPDDNWAMFDSPNIVFWDDLKQRYQLFARGWLPNPPGLHSGSSRGSGYRTIRRSVSEDFVNWSEFEMIDMGDSEPEHLYTNAATPYFRAPHIYLMFPKRFVTDRTFFEDADAPGLSEATFMTSRDTLHWDRRFMEGFIRPGLDPNNWNERNMAIGTGVVPTGPGEISLYYVENWRHASSRTRRGVLRTDGFVSVNAGWGGGEFVTKPFTFEGSNLVMNYSTSVAGHVRFEIDDGETTLASGETFGDEIERTVEWDGGADLSALTGKGVRLRVNMKEADLYSIRFS